MVAAASQAPPRAAASPPTRNSKRSSDRDGDEAPDTATSPSKRRDTGVHEDSEVCLTLHVSWTSATGTTRLARLPLDAISGVGDLRSLFRRLIRSAFPGGDDALPVYLTHPGYYKFAPRDDWVSLPGNAACTQFRLAATVGEFEMTVAERKLGASPDPHRNLMVTIAHFESEPVAAADGRQVVAELVAYPAICVRRAFLDEKLQRLRAMVQAHAAADAEEGACPDSDTTSGTASHGAEEQEGSGATSAVTAAS